jgi:hypothetical protein
MTVSTAVSLHKHRSSSPRLLQHPTSPSAPSVFPASPPPTSRPAPPLVFVGDGGLAVDAETDVLSYRGHFSPSLSGESYPIRLVKRVTSLRHPLWSE